MTEPWTDVKGLSEHSGLSTSWIYHNRDQIPHARAGAKLLFKISEFDRYLEEKHKVALQGDLKEKENDVETTIPPSD